MRLDQRRFFDARDHRDTSAASRAVQWPETAKRAPPFGQSIDVDAQILGHYDDDRRPANGGSLNPGIWTEKSRS